MGGAAGHMAHPFDCREVRNGQDLINFYVKAVNAIPLYDEETKGSSVSLKLDGVNASFRLQKADNPAGFMFVLDRGAKKRGPITGLDFDGITPDNALQRWKGNTEHGMIQVVSHMTQLLNHDLMKLKPYVEALGLFERMGPEGVFFDAEYYSNEDDEKGYQPVKNAVDYNQNYIAIHRLSEFYIETKETKTGKINTRRLTRGFYWEINEEINVLLKQKDELLTQHQDTTGVDQLIAEKNNELKIKKQEHQEILNNLARVVQEHATDLEMPFNVYTKIGVRFKEGLTREMVLRNIEEALDMRVPYNYKKINEHKSIGPTVIEEQTGEVKARTLKQLLLAIDENPAHVAYYPDTPGFTKDGESVKGKIQTKDGYKKDPKQSAFALDIYKDVIVTGMETGIGPADIGNSINDVKAINSAVIFWHAVRYIGRAIKKSIATDVDLGPAGENHEGIVIQSTDICDGIAFKFTGNFIVDNAAKGFGVTQQGVDIPSDSSEAMNEAKFRYGELLESFMVEAQPVSVLRGRAPASLRQSTVQRARRGEFPPKTVSWLVQKVKDIAKKPKLDQGDTDTLVQAFDAGIIPADKYRELLIQTGAITGKSHLPGVKVSVDPFKLAQTIEEDLVAEQKQQVVVLIPGGFKPPTGGHYSMIQQYEERSDVVKVIVVTGFKTREGQGMAITYQQSRAIFDLYGGFGSKVEFRDQGQWPTPMTACYELVKDEKFVSEYPGAVFALGASDKDKDEVRIGQFADYFQNSPPRTGVQVVDAGAARAHEVRGEAASASRMRKAFIEGDWELFKELLPDDNFYDDVIQVLNGQVQDQDDEDFLSLEALSSLVDRVITEKEEKLSNWSPPQTKKKKIQHSLLHMNSLLSLVDKVVKEGKLNVYHKSYCSSLKRSMNESQEREFDKYVETLAASIAANIPADLTEDDKIALIHTIEKAVAEAIDAVKERSPEDQAVALQKKASGPVAETSAISAGDISGPGVKKEMEDETIRGNLIRV